MNPNYLGWIGINLVISIIYMKVWILWFWARLGSKWAKMGLSEPKLGSIGINLAQKFLDFFQSNSNKLKWTLSKLKFAQWGSICSILPKFSQIFSNFLKFLLNFAQIWLNYALSYSQIRSNISSMCFKRHQYNRLRRSRCGQRPWLFKWLQSWAKIPPWRSENSRKLQSINVRKWYCPNKTQWFSWDRNWGPTKFCVACMSTRWSKWKLQCYRFVQYGITEHFAPETFKMWNQISAISNGQKLSFLAISEVLILDVSKFEQFCESQFYQNSKFRISEIVKMAIFEILILPKLISHKIK